MMCSFFVNNSKKLNNMWTEKEIKDLRNQAYDLFKTEIPLSGEIEKIQVFINQSQYGFRKASPKLIKTIKSAIEWIPNYWTFPMEIDIPDSVMDIIRQQCTEMMYSKCDELATLCNYQPDKTAEAEA